MSLAVLSEFKRKLHDFFNEPTHFFNPASIDLQMLVKCCSIHYIDTRYILYIYVCLRLRLFMP